MLREKITNAPPEVLALQALAHVAGDEDLGPRFLALSGLDSESLRARAGESLVLAAVIEFLASHEPDLLAVAEKLNVKPEALIAAGTALSGGQMGEWA
jgi:hypothetical protein